jgi:hypothetical protein
MKKLKAEFTKHGARYVLEKRTAKVAMFYIYGSQTPPDYITSVEVTLIFIRNDMYGIREGIPQDSKFGIEGRSKAFCGKLKFQQAEPYYMLLAYHWNDKNLDTLIEIYEKEYLGMGATELSKLWGSSEGRQRKIA